MAFSFGVLWTGDTAENTPPKKEGKREEWASPGPTDAECTQLQPLGGGFGHINYPLWAWEFPTVSVSWVGVRIK